DTGIDSTHPNLHVVFSKGFGPNPNGQDQNGHGTHVAGIIGGKGQLHNGITMQGVFPGVPLWSLRVLDASGSGADSDIITALDFLRQHASEVSVCNMSLGGGFFQPVNDAVDNCVKAGIVVCVAAGNSSDDAGTHSPASAPLAICVAAMCDTDG